MTKLWKCQKCGRKFEKKNQMHSCTIYPVEKHFKGKEEMKPLYNKLKEKIKKNVGSFWVESLPCCIHLVTAPAYTFAAVYALRDRIRMHFGLDYKLESSRIDKFSQYSANRYMYSIDIKSEKEIDRELLSWLRQAYNLKHGV
ncbi:MAG: DUF5655 domain-containing protein [Candidatus Micrarchaeota archaeon]|nr:DUF5655 domain-containing protein [Candidatus Micrarchaeota archaeon]